jgi:hypothetical protein
LQHERWSITSSVGCARWESLRGIEPLRVDVRNL